MTKATPPIAQAKTQPTTQQTQPQTPLLSNPYKDKLAQAAAAKDPSQLNDFNQKNAWTESKLLKLYQNPAWGKMSEEGKRDTLGYVYDRWAATNYISTGNVPMAKADWIEGAMHQELINPEENFRSKWEDIGIQYLASAGHGAATIAQGGIDFGHRMFNKAYTKVFDDDLPPDGIPWPKTQKAWYDGMHDYIDNYFDRASSWAQTGVGTTNYILGTRPSQTWMAGFAGGVGDFTPKLPYYMALGEGIVAVGGRALGAAAYGAKYMEVMGGPLDAAIGRGVGTAIDYGTNLTKALGTTRTGHLVGNALKAYSEGYVAETIRGGTPEERRREGESWAIQSTLFGLVGLNAGDLIERYKLNEKTAAFGAKIVRMGGKSLGYTLFESAIRRAFNNHINIDIFPDMEGFGPRAPEMGYSHVGVEAHERVGWWGQETPDDLNRPLQDVFHRGEQPAFTYRMRLRGAIRRGEPLESQAGQDPRATGAWEASIYPEREHWANGIRYVSKFIDHDRDIQVRAYDSEGNWIGHVAMANMGDGEIQTSWPYVEPPLRGNQIARNMYEQIPSIARSYGFTSWRSEGIRTRHGEALWKAMENRGRATAVWPSGQRTLSGYTGEPVPNYYQAHFDEMAKDIHGVKGTIPPTGIDMQFKWTPSTREEVGEQRVGRLQEMEGGRGIYDAPHPDIPNSGHLVYNNQYYPYTNLTEMRVQHERLVRRAEADIKRYDPVRASMGEAAERMLYNIAYDEFGRRDISRFTPVMLHRLYARYGQWLNEVAEQVPRFHPDEVQKEVTNNVQTQNQADPEFNEFTRRAKEELGVDTVQANTEHQIKQNIAQTRNSIFRTARDLWRRVTGIQGAESHPIAQGLEEGYSGMPAEVITPSGEYEPPEGASASYGAVTADIRRMMRAQGVANVEKVRTARSRSRRFLTDVDAREARLSGNRLASDDTNVGGRDPRTYAERLAAETTDDFVKALERSLLLNENDHPAAGGVDFEKPLSRFLFHWGDRKHLSEAMVSKLAREIRKPDTGIGRNVSYAEMDRASELVARDLIQLAKIGHTRADGRIHVFRSNQYFGPPTIWQLDLVDKVNQRELELLDVMLANHPEARRDMRVLVEALQPKRTESYGMEDWIKYNRTIDDAMRGIVTPETIRQMRAERGIVEPEAATPTPPQAEAPAATTSPPRQRRARSTGPRSAPTSVTTASGMTITRAPDFSTSREFHVKIGDKTYKMFQDPDTQYWHDATQRHYGASLLGHTRQEALNKLQERAAQAAPTSTTTPPRRRSRRQPPAEPTVPQ